jgi:hypothetical protein
MKRTYITTLVIGLSISLPLLAQTNTFYVGSNVTGQLTLVTTENAMALAQAAAGQSNIVVSHLSKNSSARLALTRDLELDWEVGSRLQTRFLPPKAPAPVSITALPKGPTLPVNDISALVGPPGHGRLSSRTALPVAPTTNVFGFLGMTHLDMRNANGGNQLNVEPPSQGLAVGNGYIVEGVNNAFQVYDMSGNPLLPAVISTNQLFGLSPALNRTTDVFGAYPTDIHCFYDQGINRWIVVQRVQANDAFDDPLPQSEEIIAVSQTGDPTANYNVYIINTTNAPSPLCPCISDYPQIGADQFGFYVSANEYATSNDATAFETNILAISKASLAAGATNPTAVKFEIPFSSGYEFSIQPATTPPGASNFLANGGLEYFVSSMSSASGSNLAVWAMSNTSSLTTTNPSLTLVQVIIPTLSYVAPNVATQKPNPVGVPLPYGSTFSPPGLLEELDGGDTRIQSATYAGGRIYVTLPTQVTDDNGNSLVGGAYVVISPAYRNGTLSASALRQGYLITNNDHILRPAIAVNAQGNGAIVFTLTGPDYYPSAAFVTFSSFAPSSAIQIAGVGAFPEDGFTGYPNLGFPEVGVARWGDYSAAVVNSDGSIFMGTEYIPNAPRAQKANWGTYLIQYIP